MKPEEIQIKDNSLKEIEERIIELKLQIANQERTQHEPIPLEILNKRVGYANRPLSRELDILEKKREFILDRRNSLLWRIVWNVIVPIIVSVLSAFLIVRFFSP